MPENGKAEIVNGELRLLSPTGDFPSRAGLEKMKELEVDLEKTKAKQAAQG